MRNRAAPTAVTFDQPGAFTWTVPAGVTTVRIDAFGASGGDCRSVRGGAGGEATAVLPVQPQQILDIHVGGQGSSCLPLGNGAGGLNGGGSGGHTGPDIGSGGGGGSDVRVGPALTDSLKIPNACNVCHTDKTTAWTAASLKTWTDHSAWRN